MRHLTKFILLVVAIAAFSLLFPPMLTATLRDALLDFLDEPTTNKIIDYSRRTEASRACGMALLLSGWTAFVVLVNFLVDAASRSSRRT